MLEIRKFIEVLNRIIQSSLKIVIFNQLFLQLKIHRKIVKNWRDEMEFANYDDYEEYENPFDGMDYDGIMNWMNEHMDELEQNGIDPENFLRCFIQ